MGSVSISLGLGQVSVAETPDLRVFVDLSQDAVVSLPVGQGDLPVWVVSPNVYKGYYEVRTDDLSSGPVPLQTLEIMQDSESDMLSVASLGLWAHDELGTVPALTYRWQRNGTDVPGATGTQYLAAPTFTDQTLNVVETATDANGMRSQISNTVAIAALPDPFAVTLNSDGTLQITGNDGRSFTLDDPADIYDGTYSVDSTALAAGPVGLAAPVLSTVTVAEVGAVLAITPALFACDPALGAVTISYTSNGANAVDATNPAAPQLLIDAEDSNGALMVTAMATQGGVQVGQISNTVAIAALPDPFAVTLNSDGTLQINNNDGSTFTIDADQNAYDGNYSIATGGLDGGPVALVATVLASDGAPAVGQTLNIRPALFAYDADGGEVVISYTTNGTNAVDVTNLDAPRLLVDAADVGNMISVTAIATQGVNSTVSPANSVSVPAASITARIVGLLGVQTPTATPSFTLDLSGAASGDKLVLVYGADSTNEPAVRVGGAPVSASFADTGSNSFGAKIWTFEHTLTEPGSASTIVDVALSESLSRHMLTAVLVTGAIRDAVGVVFQFGPGTASASVTPTKTANAIVAIAMGRGSFFGAHSWTNVAQDGAAFLNPPLDRGSAVAFGSNVPTAPYSISFEPDPGGAGNDEVALAVLAYS